MKKGRVKAAEVRKVVIFCNQLGHVAMATFITWYALSYERKGPQPVEGGILGNRESGEMEVCLKSVPFIGLLAFIGFT